MSFSWLSIMGMYEYDPTVMDGLNVPDGINKEDVVNNIMLECAELELIYPRLETMKQAISIWSNSNQLTWDKLYKTMTVDYNPIWNVDADIKDTETITGANSEDRTITRTGQDKETVNLKDKETKDLTDTKSVQGFNSSSWAQAEKVDQTGTDTIDHTGTDTIDKSEDVTDNVTGENNSTREYTQRRTGNIGVTTTQQMLEQERAIAEFNMIEYITKSFKKRFCLMVY